MRTFLTNLACPSRGKVTPMKPSTVAPLPVELIAMIMGFLQHDSRALGKCSLVCKTWFSLARHKLFRYIQVPYFAASGKNGFKPFIKFLQQSPNVRPLIKNLTLKAYSMRRLSMVSHRWWLPRRRPAILDPCTLLTICSMLPGLLTLKLDLLQWDEQWTTGKCWGRKAITPPRAGQVVSSLKELSISAMYAPHLDFLRYFSSIQHLRLSKVSGADVSSSPSTVSISAISMEHILKMESWISLFSRSGVEDSCQSLAISLLDLRSFIPSCPRSALAKWLDVGGMGSRLRHLTLQLDFVSAAACSEITQIPWSSLGLDSCTSLQSLTFIISIVESYAFGDTFWNWEAVLYVLEHIPASTINQITLHFACSMAGYVSSEQSVFTQLQRLDWGRFATTCTRFPLNARTSLKVSCRGPNDVQSELRIQTLVDEKLRAHLPS